MAQTAPTEFQRGFLGGGVVLAVGRLGCLSVICLPQSLACQRSLVEVRPTIPVRTLGPVVI